jgi:hypothetical protein
MYASVCLEQEEGVGDSSALCIGAGLRLDPDVVIGGISDHFDFLRGGKEPASSATWNDDVVARDGEYVNRRLFAWSPKSERQGN